MSGSEQESTHRTIERMARESYGRLVAYLSSNTHDLGRETVCHKIQRRGC
jgi:hypothetical protein